ncbi:uncharacterized protein LOC113005534 [Solenopsis invicta]|uniref:uncharacterized protein LOC113005534 n=1 Tax=Solenopsis invicta TaxID=13686 RepID=UPI000E33F351|nr:uncharacterized protein LOC113005534 [Solenopsis invicta]
MENKLIQLLQVLQLERWSDNLTNNDIKYDTLKYMVVNRCPELCDVIPSIGARIALQNYFINNDSDKETETSSHISLSSVSTPSATLPLANITPRDILDAAISLDNESVNNTEEYIENIESHLKTSNTQNIIILTDNEPANKKQRIETVDNMLENFDLKTLLRQSVIGQAIIASYDARSGLSSRCQQHLANIIICHFFDNNINIQLNNETLKKIADHIITLFPAECKEVYYCPPVKKKDSKNEKSGIAKEKLVDKNRNMLAFLRKCQLIPLNKSSSTHDSKDEEINEDYREEAERSRNWLKNNFEPWEEVLYHWEKSFELRRNLLHDHTTYQNLSSIFDDWNILTFSQGYILIEKDYLRLYNEKHKNVEEKFHSLFDDILKLKGKELDCSNKVLLDMSMAIFQMIQKF